MNLDVLQRKLQLIAETQKATRFSDKLVK